MFFFKNPPAAVAGMSYVDRGNLASYDFTEATLTEDGNWYDMDLSAIVGAGVRLVLLKVDIVNTAAGQPGNLRTKGYTGNANIVTFFSVANNVHLCGDRWVLTDANGVIEYVFNATTWSQINIGVRGWFV